MSQGKLSTDAFKSNLTDQVRQICTERGLNPDTSANRGLAFQFWVADLFCRREGIEASLEDSVFMANDCGIDIILEDENQKRLHLIQAKFMRYSVSIEEEEVSHLCTRHSLFLDRTWVRKHVKNEGQYEKLSAYDDLITTTLPRICPTHRIAMSLI